MEEMKITLVIGGSGSGKSAFAEQLLEEISDTQQKYYLATMQVYDEDGRKKVERHKRLRQGKGFVTIEQPVEIGQAAENMQAESAALLECMSNLTANEMFGKEILSAAEVKERILEGISQLSKKVKHLVIVSNNVFEDGIRYDESTMEYLRALAELNRALAKRANRVVEVVVGIAVEVKKESV